MVNSRCISQVSRDDAGKTRLNLRGSPERLVVSRLYDMATPLFFHIVDSR